MAEGLGGELKERTLCEINGRLLGTRSRNDVAAALAYSTQAQDLHQYPDIVLPDEETGDEGAVPISRQRSIGARTGMHTPRLDGATTEGRGGAASALPLAANTLEALRQQAGLLAAALGMQPALQPAPLPPAQRPMAWHCYLPVLAVADAFDRVHVFNAAPSKAPLGSEVPPLTSGDAVLSHELQLRVSCLAWRPLSGSCLAVGVAGGVCLWALGKGPSGTTSQKAAGREGSMWMVQLPARAKAGVTCLAWSPDGRLLAAGLAGVPGFAVWEVASGRAVPLQHSLEPVTLLRWSPCGCYLLAGGPRPGFRVWQTASWWSLPWSSEQGGAVADAAWSPDGGALLLLYASGVQAAVLYFTGRPPALDAQFLPLSLPELQGAGGGGAAVAGMAWSATGERLAVAAGPGHAREGQVALYATAYKPVVSLRFVGWVCGGGRGCGAAGSLDFAAATGGEKGTMLAVRRGGDGGGVQLVPMYFTQQRR